MPTRKTLDISHEQLTDHDIEVQHALSPMLETRLRMPNLVPVGAGEAGVRELGLAYAQLAQHGNRLAAQRAIQLLQTAERSGSDDNELHDQLGYLLQVSGSPADAFREYTAALKERPQDTTASANLAVLDAGRGDSAQALSLLQQTFAEDPSQTAAALNLAFLECRSGRKSEALLVIQKTLSFNPDSADALTLLNSGQYHGQTCTVQ